MPFGVVVVSEHLTSSTISTARPLAIEVDLNPYPERVVRVLACIVVWRGYPAKLRMDNGPEFISVKLAPRAEDNNAELEFIKFGKPAQKSFVERFHRIFRDEILGYYIFHRLSVVREDTNNWVIEYNEIRRLDSLGKLTQKEYLAVQ